MSNNKIPTTKAEAERAADRIVSSVKSEYPEIRDIRNDLSSLKNNTVALTQHAMENGADNLAAVRERAADQLDRAVEYGRDGLKVAEKRIRERPGQSLIAAFFAGVVVSFLFGRK